MGRGRPAARLTFTFDSIDKPRKLEYIDDIDENGFAFVDKIILIDFRFE